MRKEKQWRDCLLFLFFLVNLFPFSHQQIDADLLFSYDCSDVLPPPDSLIRNFSYLSPSFFISDNVEHIININYYCTPQLYDYNTETTCEDFGKENILQNNFEAPNKVCTSSPRIGILGLEFSSTFAGELDSEFGNSYFSFDFMTLGIPKTTEDQPHILIDLQPLVPPPYGFNPLEPIDVTLNFQRGTPSDFLITLSDITMEINDSNFNFGFTLYCDSYEIVSYTADSSSPTFFTCVGGFCTQYYSSITTSSPTYIATTHCRTGGRFSIIAYNAAFTTITAKIEPIISLLRMETIFNDRPIVVQSLVYLRNFNAGIFLETLRVSASEIVSHFSIIPNHWYTLSVSDVYTLASYEGASILCEQSLKITNENGISFQFSPPPFVAITANYFKYLIGGVNGFIDDVQFGKGVLSFSSSLPENPLQPNITTQNAAICDPFFYFPCNSLTNQIKNSPAFVGDDNCTADSFIDYATTGVDGRTGICKSSVYNCNSNVLQVGGVSADSLTVSYFYQQPFGNPFDSFELLTGYEIGFDYLFGTSSNNVGKVPNSINLSSHYLQFSYNFDLQYVLADTFNVSIYFHWPTVNDSQLIATFGYVNATSTFHILHGASSDFSHGNYTIVLPPSFSAVKGQASFWSVEIEPIGSFDLIQNSVTPELKAVPTITFLRLEDSLQLPILQVFSMDQTIYYNHKFYIQEACLLWNTIDYESSGWLEMFMNIDSNGFSFDTFCSDGYTYNKRKITEPSITVNTNLVSSITIGPIGGYIDEIMIFDYTRTYSINKNCVIDSPSNTPTRTLTPTISISPTFIPLPPIPLSPSPNLSFLNGPLASNDPILPSPFPSPSPVIFNSNNIGAFTSSPFPVVIPSLASSPSPQKSIAVSAEVNTANVVSIPDVVEVSYLPSDFTSPSGSIQVSETSPVLIALAAPSLGSSNIVSSTVSIITIGTSVSSSIEICLATPQDSDKDVCLGYIDESKVPPEWVCEDKCLNSKGNYLCGKTDHLTSFALLFEGLAKNGKCGSSQYEYIFGSSLKDFYLIISFAGLAILIALIAIILYSFTPARRLILGKEGTRVALLRERQTSLATLSSTDGSTDVPI